VNNKEFLKTLSEATGISGYEKKLADLISESFQPYCDEIINDEVGNLIAIKKAEVSNEKNPKIMLAAHMDEIGLMIINIDKNGFLRFTYVGGVDPRTLLGQEVIIHGKEDVSGVIGARPPHLSDQKERNTAPNKEKMFIDIGLTEKKAKNIINVGDLVSIKRDFNTLNDQVVSGKSLDDRAGVIMLYQCLKELQYLKTNVDVYAVATIQEEVGIKGAITSTHSINPDIGVAVDVCHADMPGVEKDLVVDMGDGPAVALGPHVHPKIYKKLTEIGDEMNIPYQVEPGTHPAGTDAWGIQIARSGVASALLSIPLRYMHTSVETISLDDVKAGGQLLAQFIARIDSEFVEGLRCY
jgi:endoglucanase